MNPQTIKKNKECYWCDRHFSCMICKYYNKGDVDEKENRCIYLEHEKV